MNRKVNKIRPVAIISAIIIAFSLSCVNTKDGENENQSKQILFEDLTQVDIGELTKEGNISIQGEAITIKAGGADIWGSHDEFHFAYKNVKGDFNMSVQVESLSEAHLYTKAGIMARTDLSDSSQHVYFQVFPNNNSRNKNEGGCEFQYRLEEGADMKAIYPDMTTAGNKFNVLFPDTWIRLQRKGDNFESYFSKDNQTWDLFSSFTLEMPEELMLGLAVTSHNSEEYTTAKFSSIELSQN